MGEETGETPTQISEQEAITKKETKDNKKIGRANWRVQRTHHRGKPDNERRWEHEVHLADRVSHFSSKMPKLREQLGDQGLSRLSRLIAKVC